MCNGGVQSTNRWTHAQGAVGLPLVSQGSLLVLVDALPIGFEQIIEE
jgi:hypothetical protein